MFPETVTETLSEALLLQAASLDAEERQALFFQYVEKAGTLWSLAGEAGYVMLENESDDDSQQATFSALLPLWPHRDLVALWERADIPDGEPAEIDLGTFKETWLPGLEKNQVGLILFPVGQHQTGIVISAADLLKSFQER